MRRPLQISARTLVLVLLAAATGCSCDEEPEAAPTLDDDPALRLDARVVLIEHCGDCHMRDSPKSSKPALTAIDFTAMTWAADVSELNRQQIIDNLSANLPTGGHHGTYFRVPPGQIMVVRDYIASLDRKKRHAEVTPAKPAN